MIFPTAKLDFIPNPVNFTQDWLLPAFRLVARAPAVREGTEQPWLCAELTELPLPGTGQLFHRKSGRYNTLGFP